VDIGPAPTETGGIADSFLERCRLRHCGRLPEHPRATQGNSESNRRTRTSMRTWHLGNALRAISLPWVKAFFERGMGIEPKEIQPSTLG